MPKTIHQGRNVKRFREMFGLKQEGLAYELGEEWNQKRISLLEAKEEIDDALLEQIATALKVPVDVIKNFDEQTAINVFTNSVTNHDNGSGAVFNYQPTFNLIDKWVEALEENKNLYTALLKEKDEKIALMERLLEEKKK